MARSSAEPAGDLPRFVPINEAAAYAGVEPSTLRDWARRGLLPAYRIGPRLLQVNLDDVDALRRPLPTAKSKSTTPRSRRPDK